MIVCFYFSIGRAVEQSIRMRESDERLIELVRESDREAFRLLFEKYQPILFRNVLHSIRNRDSAHDIVQETFVRVWTHRASLQSNLPVLAYLFRISRNLVRDHAKRHAVRRKLEADVPRSSPSIADDPGELLQLRMIEEKLAEVIRTKLPTKCRQIFLLSRMEEMSNSEISSHLGLSVKTVENQITRALRILRRHLQRFMQI